MIRRIAAGALALGLSLAPIGAGPVLAVGDAMDDAYANAFEDQTFVVTAPGVLANDSHDGGVLTEICVLGVDTTGLDGDLTESEDGSFSFVPSPNFSGETSFDYDIVEVITGAPCLGPQDDTATVTITVQPVNDAPTIERGSTCNGAGVSVAEDSGPFDDGPCVTVQSFGPGEGGQAVVAWTVTSNTNPGLFASGPSVVVAGDSNGRLQFSPAANAHGSATISVHGRDDGGTSSGGVDTSNEVSFTITVTAENDAPTANADSFTALPDRTLNIRAPGVLSNDSDIDGDSLTATKVSNPAHGIVTLAADGSFSYTPDDGYLGLDAFSYRALDGSDHSATRVVTLNVTAIPTAAPTIAPPTAAPPTSAPSAGASAAPSPSGSAEPSASLDPNESAVVSAAPSAGASLAPGESPAPGDTGDSGGLSIPVLVVLLLLLSLLAFGAAVYVPKWLESRRTGGSIDED